MISGGFKADRENPSVFREDSEKLDFPPSAVFHMPMDSVRRIGAQKKPQYVNHSLVPYLACSKLPMNSPECAQDRTCIQCSTFSHLN